jgi:hypothetical protein
VTYYHGTGHELTGQAPAGLYVTSDFDLAAAYALRQPTPIILILEGTVRMPDEQAYDSEYLSDRMAVIQALRPAFANVPDDFYELGDDLSWRYPELYDRRNWR